MKENKNATKNLVEERQGKKKEWLVPLWDRDEQNSQEHNTKNEMSWLLSVLGEKNKASNEKKK